MNIGGKLTGIIVALVLLVMIFTIVPEFVPEIQTATENVTSENSTAPTMIKIVFQFWWLPIVLIILGVITGGIGGARVVRRRRRG